MYETLWPLFDELNMQKTEPTSASERETERAGGERFDLAPTRVMRDTQNAMIGLIRVRTSFNVLTRLWRGGRRRWGDYRYGGDRFRAPVPMTINAHQSFMRVS